MTREERIVNGAPLAEELAAAKNWFDAAFHPSEPGERPLCPISFRYGNRGSDELLREWQAEWSAGAGHSGNLVLTDPQGTLQVRLEATFFEDLPAVEWVAYLRNTGNNKTPVISDISVLEAAFPASGDDACMVHHALGSDCKLDDFAPRETPLPPGGEFRLAPFAGRSSEGALPFFNLRVSDRGVIGAIGWTGGWAAEFRRDGAGEVRVCAGMRRTHLALLPGEQIRTPRIVLLFWQGDPLHGHNMLRRFILAHHTPRPGGQLLQGPICSAQWGENTAENQIAKARWWKDNDLPIDCYWIDAGWYGDAPYKVGSTVFDSPWFKYVGDWWPNKQTYPQGLGPIGKALREMGLGFVLWIEPERVFKDTHFTREHPEWLLGPVGDNYLFNLGLPEARRELTDLISSLIQEGGVTIYRQDFNMDPAPLWEAADAPDRVGMSEIRHIEGLYAMWDELLARHPGLVIDNCSSGGRRIDLETISRSIPLWRSDFQCFPHFDPIAIQGQTQGLAPWVPLSTGCCEQGNTYAFRSALGPGMVITTNIFDQTPALPFPVPWLRERLEEQVAVRPHFYGDFYPLLSFSLAEDVWAGWQFDRPDLGEGMVLALRRQSSPFTRMDAMLRGLEPDVRYEVRSMDGAQATRRTGRQLMETGIPIEIVEKPGSALFIYKRLS
jgi:alpha-galactosidase